MKSSATLPCEHWNWERRLTAFLVNCESNYFHSWGWCNISSLPLFGKITPHMCGLRRQGKWILHRGCEGPSVLSYAAASSCERSFTMQLRKEQNFRVKGHAVSRVKSNFEILVTQLQLLRQNNRESERCTQTVTSTVSNALVSSAERKLWEAKLPKESANLTEQCGVCMLAAKTFFDSNLTKLDTISAGFTVPAFDS